MGKPTHILLEKRLQDKAENQFDAEVDAIISFLGRDTVASQLRFSVLFNDGETREMYLYDILKKTSQIKCNFELVKENRVKRITNDSIDQLLSKVDAIKYLFEDNR